MKTQLSLFLLLFLLVSCNNDQKTCHLTGVLEDAPDTATLYLADWESRIVSDTIRVVNGAIDYKFQLDRPQKFYLQNQRNQYDFRDRKVVWLEPTEIKISGKYEFLKSLKIEGSASQTEFENYHSLIATATKQINELKEQIHFKTDAGKKQDTIRIEALEIGLSDSIVDFLLKHPHSYVTLYSLHSECFFNPRHLNKTQIAKVYNSLPENLKDLKQGVAIKKFAELPEPPQVGDMAPEIVQLTPEGDTLKLSDYRGKYVLLDFWSSSCGPCRADFKWLKKIYAQYHSKGFEILAVSGDHVKQRWTGAIAADSVPWQNISDLNGWQNEAFLRYDIRYIPRNFLINPEGIIIKEGLSTEAGANYEIGKLFED
ncbi:MAG: redoxin domain-containing protein [Draconibacterium sp.]